MNSNRLNMNNQQEQEHREEQMDGNNLPLLPFRPPALHDFIPPIRTAILLINNEEDDPEADALLFQEELPFPNFTRTVTTYAYRPQSHTLDRSGSGLHIRWAEEGQRWWVPGTQERAGTTFRRSPYQKTMPPLKNTYGENVQQPKFKARRGKKHARQKYMKCCEDLSSCDYDKHHHHYSSVRSQGNFCSFENMKTYIFLGKNVKDTVARKKNKNQKGSLFLFDLLPEAIIKHEILPFVSPVCGRCCRRVCLLSDDNNPQITQEHHKISKRVAEASCAKYIKKTSSPQPQGPTLAVYLEETTRKSNIFDVQPKRRWFLNDHLAQHLLTDLQSRRRAPSLEKFVENVTLVEITNTKVSKINGINYNPLRTGGRDAGKGCNELKLQNCTGVVYQEPTENELLGPFRFCLKKGLVRSFDHYLSLDQNKEIFCADCAEKRRLEHFEEEFDRFHDARISSIESWIYEQCRISKER